MNATTETEELDRRLAAIQAYRLRDVALDPIHDDLVRLAARACDAPVALITVLDAEQQHFASRTGTDLCGTPIDNAICVHALGADEFLEIPDLSIDPRTRDNGIVTGGPMVRFYAGAPLRVAGGTAIGTLCVLDVAARPGGLSPEQRDTLIRLARQATTTLELRRSLAERDLVEQRLIDEGLRWQQLFENIGDGFALAEVVRGPNGHVTDWRYLDANPAWYAMTGFDPAAATTASGRMLDPDAPVYWVQALDALMTSGIPLAFVYRAHGLGRWFRGRCFRIGAERFGIILHDTTEELAAAARQAALIRLGEILRDSHDIDEVTRAASTLVGETLSVTRAAFGQVDGAMTMIDVGPDWTSGDAVSVAGRHHFAMFGALCDPMVQGNAVAIDDVRTDPRCAPLLDMLDSLQVGALVKLPVRRDGRVVAILMVHNATARHWTPEEIGFLRKVADRVEVGVKQVEAEVQQRLLIEELAHRLKNTLSMVQAIASQTLRGLVDRAPLDAFEKRLQTLGIAHDVLVDRNWVGADLRATIAKVIAVFGCDERIALRGPEVALGARAALSLALILHELGTNAIKYGALSNAEGRVTLSWQVARDQLTLRWVEQGGPPVAQPRRRGFGSKLLRLGLTGTGDSELTYHPAGLQAVMRAALSDLAGG